MYKNIKASDLKGKTGNLNIIDIRNNYLYNLGSIPGSKNIPSNYLLMYPEKYLKKEDEYYIYCTQGMESPKLCAKLTKQGYNVVNVLGGYHDYITS